VTAVLLRLHPAPDDPLTTEAVIAALRLAGCDVVSRVPARSAWRDAALEESANRDPTAADGSQARSPRRTPGATRA
jgi:hypothetical protein